MGVIQQATIDELQKQIKRLERLNEENVKRATAAQEQDAREIAALREQLTKPSVIQEMTIQSLRERLDERDAEIAQLREAIQRESEKHNIFNKPECDCRICRIAREGR